MVKEKKNSVGGGSYFYIRCKSYIRTVTYVYIIIHLYIILAALSRLAINFLKLSLFLAAEKIKIQKFSVSILYIIIYLFSLSLSLFLLIQKG